MNMKINYFKFLLVIVSLCLPLHIIAQKTYDVKKVPAGTSIRIDGDFTDWEELSGFPEDAVNQFYHTRLNNTALIAPDDQLDHQATWRLAYTDDRLYGYFMVQDDFVQDPAELTNWFHDKLEMYLKVGDDATIPEEKGDIGGICDLGYYQYVFDINNTNPDFVQGALPGNEICVPIMDGNWDHAVTITDLGYSVEWSIRFEGLKDKSDNAFDPASNNTLYFAPHVHDNDNTDYGEVNPRARSYWSMENQGGDALTGGHAFEKAFWELGTAAADGAPGEAGAPGTLNFTGESLNFNLPSLPNFPQNAAKTYTLTKLTDSQSITIDGEDTDWESLNLIDEDQVNVFYHQRVNNTALIAPDDQLDHQASWKLAYDENGIYGFFEVQDDVVQDPAEVTSWYHDKLEMYFKVGDGGIPSTKGDIGGLCNQGFFQYVFDINNTNPEFVQGALPGNEICVPLMDGNWEHEVIITPLGYNVEWFISFDGLVDEQGVKFDPTGNVELRFAPHVHDNDNTELGEVNPRARSYWSMQNQGGDAVEGGHAFEKNFWMAGTEAAAEAPGESGAPGILLFGSAVTSIADLLDADISVYPNPATDILNIDSQFNYVEIINTNGKLVRSAKNVKAINISQLRQGIYMVRLYQKGKVVKSGKFIKE